MRAVAYCRVSTNKDEQLDSLESQQSFFTEYAKKRDFNLIKIYADEGKSGTKMKNRTELLKMLSDANRGNFDTVLIKDISRLARNTVDFLTSIRKLKALGVRVVFVNYDQTDSDSSEFTLTLLSAMAQEESANTSKRVKFGKKQNAEHGRVPNIVYGYDKIIGDYFTLQINEKEAATVRLIFDMYVNMNMGANKVATELNRKGISTKRGCKWSQNAISRILTNEIYIGKIINGKQEVEDFLTGKRKDKSEENWQTTCRPELRLIDDEIFVLAAKILKQRTAAFNLTGERSSEKHVFSKMIKCTCCGKSFRRVVRQYKNTYVKWVCTGRNSNGADSCQNKTVIDEAQLLEEIRQYFIGIMKDKPNVVKNLVAEFNRQYKTKDTNEKTELELTQQLSKEKRNKEKYIEMYKNDIISMEELRGKTSEINSAIDTLVDDIKLVQMNINKGDLLENILKESFKSLDSVISSETITNNMLSSIIDKITCDENGKLDVYLKLISDIGLEQSVLVNYNRT